MPQFLLRAVMPTVLHVVIAIAAGYAVGSEFSRRSMQRLAATAPAAARWSRWSASCCRCSASSCCCGRAMPGIIHGLFRVPFRGRRVLMAAAACLFIVAYQSLGGAAAAAGPQPGARA